MTMHLVKRLIATYLFATAIAVALHFVFSAFYQDAVDLEKVWNIVNWFMAFAVLISLVVWSSSKIDLDQSGSDGNVSRRYLEVNAALFATVLLTLWFFWNWFDNLVLGSTPQGDTRLIMWAFIDPLFVLIVGLTGCHICPRRGINGAVLRKRTNR